MLNKSDTVELGGFTTRISLFHDNITSNHQYAGAIGGCLFTLIKITNTLNIL